MLSPKYGFCERMPIEGPDIEAISDSWYVIYTSKIDYVDNQRAFVVYGSTSKLKRNML